MINGKKILITGGAGFIGSNLSERLVKFGNEVLLYDNFNDYYSGKEKNLEKISKFSNFNLIKQDILNFDELLKAMKKVEIVFHLAAQPGVRYSFNNPYSTNKINIEGTLNVLNAAIKCGVEKIIYASSSSVYGRYASIPFKENSNTEPISIYGASKLCAENYCKIFYLNYDLNVVSLRYFTVYGPRQRTDMAIHKFVRQIKEGTPITIYGDGEQTRDFTYIDDIIEGSILAASIKDIGGLVFNIGSGKNISINELIDILKDKLGAATTIYTEKKKGDIRHTLADISKANKILNYHPKISLEKGLDKFIKWFDENN
jgi:UDP-glucose 4-epimerase